MVVLTPWEYVMPPSALMHEAARREGLSMRAALRTWVRPLLFALAAAGVWLIATSSVIYFTHPTLSTFWIQREPISESSLWRVAFLVHVSGGIVCLAAALPQFSGTLLRRVPGIHRVLGWTYVVSVLLLVVPPGLYLALHAGGGLVGRVGFLVNGFLLMHTTWRGLTHVRARDFKGHVVWMVRSWAMAATALSFRALFILYDVLGLASAYPLAIWSSVLLNAALAEVYLLRRRAPSTKGHHA